MAATSQLESLNRTLFCWRLLGIWPGENPSRFYRFYTVIFLFSTMIIYDTALAVNLFCTPLKIELLIQEVTFFFNVVSITTKILMVIVWRKRITKLLEILDSEMFQGKDDATRNILAGDTNSYTLYRNILLVMGHFAYAFNSVVPIIANLVIPSYVIKLPTSNYYFLGEDTKNDYFAFIFGYQAFGIYGLMMSDISVDTFINGCLFFAISQTKVLYYNLSNLKPDKSLKLSRESKEYVQIKKLNESLRHYECILKYCAEFQTIINVTLFIQYTMGAMIICVLLCGLLLPLTSEEYTFMVTYLSAMIMQIFVPGWLGTQLTYQSQELVFAAYNSDWIPRKAPFKRSIKIFVERANTPIVLVGLKMFPLSLETFTSIMKTAYSFMTLVRNIQDLEE
ncbi:odorant receptor Or2-like [Bicyclus anynana]|uniref:Odorant receptor n=1 Tax=Bicyclus anynana TaxID=110368 RepID=A0A6J1P5Q5_BICAN|nr:odorant receptor Or2-like [Bicyclus anynana]